MKREVDTQREGEALVAYLSGEIDHHRAKGMREAIDCAFLESGLSCLTLDFSAVKFMDSSGIALIIGRAELCSERGARLIVRSLSASLYRIVKISGIEKHKSVTLL